LIDQTKLVAAFHAWTLDKSRSLADHLVALGHLNAAQRAAIEALSALHVESHGGDSEKSLAALSAGRSTRERLAELGDPDINATLARVGPGSTEPDDDRSGQTLSLSVGTATTNGQRFRVLRPHARGGLGALSVALDTELNREVALKEILDSHADDPASRRRFVREAEITGGLEHPGIAPVYGLGTYGDGRPYYAMRFIRGDSLKDVIARFHADESLRSDPGRRSFELRKLLRRFLDACNAIEYAHSRGVLHRDIKPSNVIVGRHGETLVVDWGLAKVVSRPDPDTLADERTLRPPSASGSAETLPGQAIGTPAYMSPEQARGDLDALGPRSDVYSLGVTLYSLLTWKTPFEGGDISDVLRRVQAGEFPWPRAIDPSIDRALEAVCLKAMALKPEDRYGSPRALAEDVERWAADEPVSAWREPLSRRARRWARRHRTAVAVGASAAALLLAGGLYYNARLRHEVLRGRQAEREAVAGRNEALTALNQLVYSVQDRLGDWAVTRPVRESLLGTAIDGLKRIADRTEASAPNISRAVAHQKLGSLFLHVGHLDDARRQFDQADRLAEALARAEPGNLDVADCLRGALAGLGDLSLRTGPNQAAQDYYRRAVQLSEAVVAADPRREGATRALVEAYLQFGRACAYGGEADAAEGYYRQMRDLARRWVADEPTNNRARDLLTTSYRKLGDARKLAGEYDQARSYYQDAIAIGQEVLAAEPGAARFKFALAIALDDLAGVAYSQRRFAESRALYAEAERHFNDRLEADPEDVETQLRLVYLTADVARLDVDESQFARAAETYGRALRRLKALEDRGLLREMPAPSRRWVGLLNDAIPDCRAIPAVLDDLTAARSRPMKEACRLLAIRARVVAVRGEEGKLIETATALGDLEARSAEDAVALACGLGTCVGALDDAHWPGGASPGRQALRRRCFDRAFAALQQAVALGYRVIGRMEEDPDLTPVRSHPDYRKLVARVVATMANRPTRPR
jgi:serine/threonine-protein kinase